MRLKVFKLFAVVMITLFIACSSGNERMIQGKWALSGTMIAGSPTSLWFKSGGRVVGPWEKHRKYMESSGEYEIIDDTQLKIKMEKGYYKGNIFYFDIVKLDEKEMVLLTNFQKIKMKRVEEE